MIEWMARAACLDRDVNDFFDNYVNDITVAREVDDLCRGCPVKRECRNYGALTKSSGIWGGVWHTMGRKVKTPEDIWQDL